MADPYIDQFETQVYGKYCRDQMQKVCLGRLPKLDGMVEFAIAEQARADADMKAVLDKQPKPVSTEDAAALLEEARDTVIRFGAYLNSLKGYPVSPKVFFRGEAPSELARKRLVKLAAALEHIAAEIPKHEAIKDPSWAKDFKTLSKKLETLKGAQQDAKVEKADLGPEVAAQREKWLAVYNANKLLIRGLLAHAGKSDLLPLIFDDLAEVHRAQGVTDALPTPGDPNPTPTPA
ncbi:MAG: hypothetical protein IPK82_30505 [Polyangiaceae bacterium]|nr:hypothetical protein [Polyangiaceae bacterium]